MSLVLAQLEELLALVQAYESSPKKRADEERLLTINTAVLASYGELSGNMEAAKAVDRLLDHFLRASDSASTLRLVLLQLHATVFHYKAGGALGVVDAYTYACELRGSEADRVDARYFKAVAVPRLLDPINLLASGRVRLLLMAAIAREILEFDPIIDDDTTDERITDMPRALLIIGLVRRWELGSRKNLVESPNSIENRLFRRHELERLAREDNVVREMFGPRGMGYVKSVSLWSRIKRWLLRCWYWLRNPFASRPVQAGRGTLYVLLGLVSLVAAVLVIVFLLYRNGKLLEQVGRSGGAVASIEQPRTDSGRA